MTIILGAMEGEIVEVTELVADGEQHTFRRYRMTAGTIFGHPVLVARSGCGKTYAAMVSQHLIDVYEPSRLIFTGLAGSINPQIDIGDTIVADDCLQHDLDASAVGFRRGEIPFENLREIAGDPELLEIAGAYRPPEGTLHRGRIVTGDQFFDRARLAAAPFLRDELHGDAVEMEGASVAAVCHFNGVPFCLVRTISDRADSNARVDFERFVPKASLNAAEFVKHVMSSL